MPNHPVKVYEQGRFTVFWIGLTGGRGVLDLHVETELFKRGGETSRSELGAFRDFVKKTAEEAEAVFSANLQERHRYAKAARVPKV